MIIKDIEMTLYLYNACIERQVNPYNENDIIIYYNLKFKKKYK